MKKNNLNISLAILILLSIFLRFYAIQSLIPFFADQGWFYLSAKNMLLIGTIPLVGITASHVWLHQGAYWTYLLAGCLFIFHCNPLSGAYLTAGMDVASVYLIYIAGKRLLSKRIALIASCIYATSPLIIVSSRTAYHTSLIPFFTILLLLTFASWIRGNTRIIPIIIGLLAVLYNFEIATLSLSFVFLCVLFYGYWQKRLWAHIFSRQNVLGSLVAYLITMFPMLLYDVSHQFPQTIKILLWIIYKVVSSLGIYRIHPESHTDWLGLFRYFSLEIQRLVFMQNEPIALVLFIFSILFILLRVFKQFRKKCFDDSIVVLLLFVMIPLLILLANGVISDAYFPVILPSVVLVIAYYLDSFFSLTYRIYPVAVFIFLIMSMNIYSLFSSAYFTSSNLQPKDNMIFPLSSEETIIFKMERFSGNKTFLITSRGLFPQSNDNYLYLAGWMGAKISKSSNNVFTLQPASYPTEKENIIYRSESIIVTFKRKNIL